MAWAISKREGGGILVSALLKSDVFIDREGNES